VPVLHAAEHIFLAMLEILVHTKDPAATTKYLKAPLRFDEGMLKTISLDELPAGWDADPPFSVSQLIGDAWALSNVSPVLRVPSAVVPEEWNYIIDPQKLSTAVAVGERHPCGFDPCLDK
jgi:RES domain-containing protein